MSETNELIIIIIFRSLPLVAFFLGILIGELEYRSTMGKFPFKKPYIERKWGIKDK